jgi:23S rRNA pseudoU1915 N3-methylase RlmH
VVDRADDVIKLSDMVLNHQASLVWQRGESSSCTILAGSSDMSVFVQIAHLVLMEQLYRGYTILRGEQYHH